ncbi:MAG: sigma 54-interacting transcriptional regulator [Planctomycetaceae bacterium]
MPKSPRIDNTEQIMQRVLVTWIGRSDLKACAKGSDTDPGPVLRLLKSDQRFHCIHVLNDFSPADCQGEGVESVDAYLNWLTSQAGVGRDTVSPHPCENLHNNYGKTFEFTADCLNKIAKKYPSDATHFSLLVSPGTPAAQSALMASWKLFANSSVSLFATSREAGVEEIKLPYVLSVDVLPKQGRRTSAATRDRSKLSYPFSKFEGASRSVLGVLHLADRAAKSDASVLLLGESGTGKEILAREIHDASTRSQKPFVALNCAALGKDLVASELFGHVKGGFTGAISDKRGLLETAHSGTLFLDELGEIPLETQTLLLRFLEDGKFRRVGVGDGEERQSDVRIIAATNRDLHAAIVAKEFRADFLFRINVIPIELPPLRYRGEDVELLARSLLVKWNSKQSPPANKTLSDDAIVLLKQFPWHGNVRELKAAIERIAVLCDGAEITADDVDDLGGISRQREVVAISQLPEAQFLAHLAATIDESLARYGNDPRVVSSDVAKRDVLEEVLWPLLVGRAAGMTANDKQAGMLVKGVKYEFNNASRTESRLLVKYQADWKPKIDETEVRHLRQGYD